MFIFKKSITMKRLGVYIFFALFVISCSKEKRSDKAAGKMHDFVINITEYARKYNNDFIIIPQNGIELAFNNQDVNDGIHESYTATVNGFGIEELYYNGTYSPDNYRINFLKALPGQ